VRDTLADRILRLLKESPLGLDYDKTAAKLGVSPRQQVNSICRQLESKGLIHRKRSDGKIVNFYGGSEGWSKVDIGHRFTIFKNDAKGFYIIEETSLYGKARPAIGIALVDAESAVRFEEEAMARKLFEVLETTPTRPVKSNSQNEASLQGLIKDNLAQMNLTVDSEYFRLPSGGEIDILAKDTDGHYVVIEIKNRPAKSQDVGQLVEYVNTLQGPQGSSVTGLLIAKEYTDRVRIAASSDKRIRLLKVAVSFE